jgi:hypothetical protein
MSPIGKEQDRLKSKIALFDSLRHSLAVLDIEEFFDSTSTSLAAAFLHLARMDQDQAYVYARRLADLVDRKIPEMRGAEWLFPHGKDFLDN